jgi:plasmid maintenance system antidote protein VapI
MTLHELFHTYGITRPADLAAILKVHNHYAWALWHGKRRFSTKTAMKLYEARGIPIHELLQATVEPGEVPRGRPKGGKNRPRKQPPKKGGGAE